MANWGGGHGSLIDFDQVKLPEVPQFGVSVAVNLNKLLTKSQIVGKLGRNGVWHYIAIITSWRLYYVYIYMLSCLGLGHEMKQ